MREDLVRTTLRSAAAQRELEHRGYVVVPFGGPDLAAQLRAACVAAGPAPGDEQDGFFPGINSESISWKRQIDGAVRAVMDGVVADTFEDHHLYSAALLTKWPGPAGDFPAHQDPTMVEPHRGAGVTAWTPLTPTVDAAGRDCGTLMVVPGSHRLCTEDVSWYGTFNPERFEHLGTDIARFAVEVPVAVGEAVVFYQRLIHLSRPNQGDDPRLAVAMALRPAEAPNVHVEHHSDEVQVFAVDDEFYFGDRRRALATHPGDVLLRVPRRPAPLVTVADLEQLQRSLEDQRDLDRV